MLTFSSRSRILVCLLWYVISGGANLDVVTASNWCVGAEAMTASVVDCEMEESLNPLALRGPVPSGQLAHLLKASLLFRLAQTPQTPPPLPLLLARCAASADRCPLEWKAWPCHCWVVAEV